MASFIVILCSLVGDYKRFDAGYNLCFQSTSLSGIVKHQVLQKYGKSPYQTTRHHKAAEKNIDKI